MAASPSTFIRAQQIVDRMHLELPVHTTLVCPISGEPFNVARDNYSAILMIDMHNLTFEHQVVASLSAEAGRAQRAAEYMAVQAEIRFRKWKGQRFVEARVMPKTAADKDSKKKTPAPKQATKDDAEAAYRAHEDYEDHAMEPARLRAIAGLFQDIKEALSLKQRLMHDYTRRESSYERVETKADNLSRLKEIETLEQEAGAAIARSGSAEAAAAYVRNRNPREL